MPMIHESTEVTLLVGRGPARLGRICAADSRSTMDPHRALALDELFAETGATGTVPPGFALVHRPLSGKR